MKPDEELRRDVEAELESEPTIDGRKIGVAAVGGVVTLAGHVDSYVQKWKAERAVERVKGVRGIVNEIEVNWTGQHSDVEIARHAVDALKGSMLVPDDAVKVRVDKGWITLKGEIDHDYQRRAAERALRDIPGVRGITNLVTIKHLVEPKNIKEEIERAFTRQAVLDASRITVEVDGSEVTLQGIVSSWIERHEAERAAWNAPGVTSVKNLLTVAAAA